MTRSGGRPGHWAAAASLCLALVGVFAPGRAGAQDRAAVVIRMYDEGFVPNAVEVQQGEPVVFENRGKGPHWPASNIHPTHQVYPEFDPRREIPAGERWTFRFDRPGDWRFHDHLHPESFGSVVVRERPRGWLHAWETRVVGPAKRLVGASADALEVSAGRLYYRVFPARLDAALENLDIRRVAASDEQLRYWIALVGSRRMMALLLQQSGGGSIFECHEAAHQIGRVSYALDGAAALQKADPFCTSGFYHGALEGFLRERGTFNFTAEVERLCGESGTQFMRSQCLHGMGHGVMAYQGYDLPGALKACGALKERPDRRTCYDGVFMENIVVAKGAGALRGHRTPWVSQDPHFPCNAISQERDVQFHCYYAQTSWMLTLHRDFDAVVRECLKIPEAYHVPCLRSLGRDIASATLRDAAATVELCGKVPRERAYYAHCLHAAVEVIVSFWGDGLRDQASDVCRRLDDGHKRSCYEVIAGWLDLIFTDPARRREVCQSFEPAHRDVCKGA